MTTVHPLTEHLHLTLKTDRWGPKFMITCGLCATTVVSRTRDPIRLFVYQGHGWPGSCPYATTAKRKRLKVAKR